MKEALLYEKLGGKKVRCKTCSHYCVVENGKRGICGVRENQNGRIYSRVYGKAAALNIDPIEKKPFFHFLPGSYSLSFGTVGCNFKCSNCHNYDISQAGKKNKEKIFGADIPPEKIIEIAKDQKLPSISYTYNEPTVFLEYALDTMKLAQKAGLKNTWVTNGFFSEETFKEISPYLDAANVDLKSFNDEFYQENCGARLQPVLDNLKRLKDRGIWLEVTTLIIPKLSDSGSMLRRIANFIKKELGPETPWHVTQFSGAISWKLQKLPDTPVAKLEAAHEKGKEAGLKYVYTGNIPGLDSEDTSCPKCQAKMIKRMGYLIQRFDNLGRCSNCGENLNITDH